MVQTQFQTTIKILRSNNGGEFINASMKNFFSTHGLVHQTTCAHTPQKNGVDERKNRLLLKITRAIMLESHTPTYLWPEAVATATYLVNRLPTKILHFQTPLHCFSQTVSIPEPLNL